MLTEDSSPQTKVAATIDALGEDLRKRAVTMLQNEAWEVDRVEVDPKTIGDAMRTTACFVNEQKALRITIILREPRK